MSILKAIKISHSKGAGQDGWEFPKQFEALVRDMTAGGTVLVLLLFGGGGGYYGYTNYGPYGGVVPLLVVVLIVLLVLGRGGWR